MSNYFLVTVAGGRDYAKADVVARVMGHVLREVTLADKELVVNHGACGCDAASAPTGHHPHPDYSEYLMNNSKGLDGLVHRWCLWRDVAVNAWPASWSVLGLSAGPSRNESMLSVGCHLFISFPGGRGTADASARAARYGYPVWGVNRDGKLLNVSRPDKPATLGYL